MNNMWGIHVKMKFGDRNESWNFYSIIASLILITMSIIWQMIEWKIYSDYPLNVLRLEQESAGMTHTEDHEGASLSSW